MKTYLIAVQQTMECGPGKVGGIVSLAVAAMLAVSALPAFAGAPAGTQPASPAAKAYVPFEGQKTAWHGFDRYDYVMDEATMAIKPATPGAAGRKCIVVVPKTPAAGNPWSWQGCYWDHQPQTEVELLKRGFHIAYITADVNLRPDKKWDAWYAFLTEGHGLFRKPAFIGMSRGGEFSYVWATTHPDKVACIYGDNPGGNPENLARLDGLARNDVPIVQVCGTIDPLLERFSTATENTYHQVGGRISVLLKEGAAHHPHSLQDPKFLADFIETSVKAAMAPAAAAPAWAGRNFQKSSYYSFENFYVDFPKEGNCFTCSGPLFTPCYDRYDVSMGFDVPVTVIAPTNAAPGNPWVFRADPVARDNVVDQGLLARGFHIVVAPTGWGDNTDRGQWDALYKRMTDAGLSRKPVMEGVGGAGGDAYAWAILNADKVSCIYVENPTIKNIMTRTPPILDNLAALAKAGVPIMHVCGSLDPWLKDNTLVLEKKYKDLGGKITVIIKEGVGHFPAGPKDPKPVLDFVVGQQSPAAAAGK
jgi:pimeloyl-ACP methyl ester carboxylesterase